MALDPGPGIIDAIWGKTKQVPIRKSDKLEEAINTSIGRLDPYRSAQDKSLADYSTALQGIKGQVGQLSKEDLGTFGNLIGKSTNYDAEQGFKNLGDYLTGLWGNAAGTIKDYGLGATNLARANIYGGQGAGTGTSSYDKNLLWNNVSRNLAPAFQTALSSITPAFQSVNAAQRANLGDTLNLMSQRAQVPFRTAGLELMPAEARSRFMTDEIAALSGLGGAVNQNLAGFKSEDNAIRGAMGAINKSQEDVTDLAMKAASMYFGGGAGGALGGMMGGMGGGGGGGGGMGGMGGQMAGMGGGYPGFQMYPQMPQQYPQYQQFIPRQYQYQYYPSGQGPGFNTAPTTPQGLDPFGYNV